MQRLPNYILKLSIIIAVILTASGVSAKITVDAQVDRTRIQSGESLELSVTIENSNGQVDISSIKDFKVVSQTSHSTINFINGQTSQKIIYVYTLEPLIKSGKAIIPRLRVKSNGKTYQSEPIEILVNKVSAKTKPSKDLDVWITAKVSNSTPFTGQQIIYTFTLYNSVQIHEAKFSPPEFLGFEATEFKKTNAYKKIIKGREHIVTELNYVLIPKKTGALVIEPSSFNFGILDLMKNRDRSGRSLPDFLMDPFFNPRKMTKHTIRTLALNLTVKPLPEYTGHGGFSGLVGKFELKTDVETSNLKVGDSTTLSVTLKGQGNIIDAGEPDFKLPDAFKIYEDNPEEKISLDRTGYSGYKIFRKALVPVKQGSYEIRPVSLTYFDITEKAYKKLTSQPIILQVAPSQTAQAAPPRLSSQVSASRKQKVDFTGRDILPPKEELEAVQSQNRLSLFLFILLLASPLPLLAGLLIFQRLTRNDTRPAILMKNKARKALKAAINTIDQQNEMLAHLYQAVNAAIFSIANRSGEALTWKEARELLTQCGQPPQIAQQASDLLSRVESAKFSAAELSDHERKALTEDVRRLFKELLP
ncbi:MAG: protein BatD [Desulfobacteraceae bacterium]|nr:protein BatD [Desulfobacteraceae bacterium]